MVMYDPVGIGHGVSVFPCVQSGKQGGLCWVQGSLSWVLWEPWSLILSGTCGVIATCHHKCAISALCIKAECE